MLAEKKGLHLKELPNLLGFSERMLFGYRSGKYPITAKAWRKLEQAERAAGIAPSLREQLAKAASAADALRLMESASVMEVYRELPERARRMFAKGKLDGMNAKMLQLFIEADALARKAQEYLSKPPSKTAQRDLKYFAEAVAAAVWPARDVWDTCHKLLRERLGLDDDDEMRGVKYEVTNPADLRVAEERKK